MHNKIFRLLVLWMVLLFFGRMDIQGCTNFLITRGASVDGSVFISYAVDSHVLYGELYYTPAGRHLKGSLLDVYEWDTGKFLGKIGQLEETYSVVGNINEHQVAIGETTFGGREELKDPKAIMDYGSLMYIMLQRAKTARQGILIIADLVKKYGYYSSGESLSISDKNEAWIMEIISKGPDNKGAVWVARRIPDGYISAHANQARIRQFPLNDKQNCLYADDVISFAREKGYYKGNDEDFSFADAYAPADFGALRFCEARVWSMFRRAAPSLNLSSDYVMGKAGAQPLPLWIKPDRRLSLRDVMELMRDHFEGSELDLSRGVGAGPYRLPYRWRPMTWKVDGVEYLHERSTSTQQTGWSFITQSRSWLPDVVGGIIWIGMDDTYSTVYVPMYGSMREIPKAYAVGTADFSRFSWDSAFWVFNFVANYAYSRYCDMIQDIQKVQRELEGNFIAVQPDIETTALKLFEKSPNQAREYLNAYSVRVAEQTVKSWKKLGEFLIFKYLDGNVKDELNRVTHPGYPEDWYRRIVQDSGDLLIYKKFEDKKDSH